MAGALLAATSWTWNGGTASAGGLRLAGHLGGVAVSEEVDGLADADWNTGVADLAIEASLFGPLTAGIGGEVLLDKDPLAVSSKQAGFAYLKLRMPLPLSPYVGLGLDVRRTEIQLQDAASDSAWRRGRLLMAGVGFKLTRVSLDLEFRATHTEFNGSVLRLYSLRPGVTLWF
jgi:opacity protein-like surface antigen